MESIEKEPQINADERRLNEPDNCAKSCHGSEKLGTGMSTYALRGIRVRGVENPQGFGVGERRLITSAHRKVSYELKFTDYNEKDTTGRNTDEHGLDGFP